MAPNKKSAERPTYPIRVAASLTGLKPELIRSWETRYEAIRPSRSGGGSRRYSDDDLERLGLLGRVVEAGHRISSVAGLDDTGLRDLLDQLADDATNPIEGPLESLKRLDSREARERLENLLSGRDPVDFAKEIALPILVETGARWHRGELGISAEHLTTSLIRSILMQCMASMSEPLSSPTAVFATPSGETHDVGTLAAALVAVRCGVNVLFLGADMPTKDLVHSVADSRADVLVMGLVTLPAKVAQPSLEILRAELPTNVELWAGGAGIDRLPTIKGVERVANLEQAEARFRLLGGVASDHLVTEFDPKTSSNEGQ